MIYYPINEIFVSIQGEASFTGAVSIFIRLQGCDVGCAWCDTKYTWNKIIDMQTDFISMINKTQDNEKWANVELTQLMDYLSIYYIHISHVVITGGEPAIYDLKPLCQALESLNKSVQIETSGTYELNVTSNTWVTLSPKINMPNKKLIIKSAVIRANEIKMPIGKIADIVKLQQFIIDYEIQQNIQTIYLQPLSQNLKATALCVEYAIINNWYISVQIHKYLNIK